MSSRFLNVILEAGKQRQEKEVHYTKVRDARRKELHEQASEVDRLMDGRRNRGKKNQLKVLGS